MQPGPGTKLVKFVFVMILIQTTKCCHYKLLKFYLSVSLIFYIHLFVCCCLVGIIFYFLISRFIPLPLGLVFFCRLTSFINQLLPMLNDASHKEKLNQMMQTILNDAKVPLRWKTRKFLDIFRVRKNGIFSFYIHNRSHNKFNEQILP